MKAKVLQQHHRTRLEAVNHFLHCRPNYLVHLDHVALKDLAEPGGHGVQPKLLDHRALRSPQVGAQHQVGPQAEQVVKGRNGVSDPEIVGDASVLQRDVEVAPDQDPAAGQLTQILDRP
jgi:hypothetical protein